MARDGHLVVQHQTACQPLPGPMAHRTQRWSFYSGVSLLGQHLSQIIDFLGTGHDIAFDGNVRGDMQVQVTLDGNVVNWDPSGDVLFSIHGVDNLVQHMLSLRVANTAANAHLTINQVRINGSAFTDMM